MISLFTMLQRDEELSGAGRLPEWQATHPDPGNRIKNVQSLIAASTENFASKTIGADEFLTRIDGMVYGENPRAGYFRGTVFIHPDFEFDHPGGNAATDDDVVERILRNRASIVAASSFDERA